MAQRRKQVINTGPSARRPAGQAPVGQPKNPPLPPGASIYGTANSGPNPDGSGSLTPTTPTGGYQVAPQGQQKQNQIKAYSDVFSNELGGYGAEANQRGNDALAQFYGIEKPADTSAQDAVDFMRENQVDPALAGSDEIDRAFGLSESLIDSVMNTPSQTKIIGDQVLSQQLALGRSSPGGIGNVQAGVKAAMGAAPQLQQQAQQASINEQVARAQAATGAANIYAGVAQGTADRAVRIGESNQTAATNVLATMTQKYGMDLNFTTEQRGQVGQLARDFFNNQAQFAQMDVTQQTAAWDAMVRTYGIDSTLKAAMEQIAAQENIGPLDAFKLVLGSIDALGSLVPKPGG